MTHIPISVDSGFVSSTGLQSGSPYGRLWAHMGPDGSMWAHMGPHGSSWTDLGRLRKLSVNFLKTFGTISYVSGPKLSF